MDIRDAAAVLMPPLAPYLEQMLADLPRGTSLIQTDPTLWTGSCGDPVDYRFEGVPAGQAEPYVDDIVAGWRHRSSAPVTVSLDAKGSATLIADSYLVTVAADDGHVALSVNYLCSQGRTAPTPPTAVTHP